MKKVSTVFYVQRKVQKEWITLFPDLPIKNLTTAKFDVLYFADQNNESLSHYQIIKRDVYIKETIVKYAK